MTIAELLATTTEEAQFAALIAALRDRGVPVDEWISEVNTDLSLTHLVAERDAEEQNVCAQLAASNYLETATGEGLTLHARSRFNLERYAAVFAEHLFLLTSVSAAPRHVLDAGRVLAGQPGSTGLLYSNTFGGTLEPGGKLILRMRCQTAGPSGNLAARSTLALRDALVGATVSNPPALIVPGADANGGVMFSAVSLSPVQVQITQDVALSVAPIGQLVRIRLAVGSTAAQVAAAVNADPVAALLVYAQATGTGATAAGTWSTTTLTSSVVLAGTPEEEDGAVSPPTGLKGRCITRYATTGAGGSEDAMIYWALAAPAGWSASPVRRVKPYSNRYGGVLQGASGTILVAGASGALSAAELTAVQGNFENPRKYALGTLVSIETTTNKTVSLGGTVYVLRGSRYSPTEVKSLVAAELARYQAEIPIGGQGGLLYRQKVGARIEDAARESIRNVVLTLPISDPTIAYNESVILDGSALVYELVDQ